MFMIDLDVESHYSLLGVPSTATRGQILNAKGAMVNELRRRQRQEPALRKELVERETIVNAAFAQLASPEKRAKYDRDNAHLRFFAVRGAAAPMFVDPGDRMDVLYRALSAYLTRAGVRIRPLSDLGRVDFQGDETHNSLLDGLLG